VPYRRKFSLVFILKANVGALWIGVGGILVGIWILLTNTEGYAWVVPAAFITQLIVLAGGVSIIVLTRY